MRAPFLASLVLVSVLTACGKGPEKALEENANKGVLLAAEDLLQVNNGQMASGPVISGSLQPTKKADLRSEISAIVLEVVKDNGDRVRKGDLLVRLDDTAIRDNLNSAREAERASGQAFEQAQRQLERLNKLSNTGAVSAQALEDAEVRRNAAQSDFAAARARVVQASQQLQRTEVRAPFDGVVSDRTVNAGDTAQIGKQLMHVIDPASIRFEGYVSTEQLAQVKAGNIVNFRVNGYHNEDFSGKVQRINPMVNANTRQTEIHVSIDPSNTKLVAGLFAEGRVKTQFRDTLLLPESALVREGEKTYVWRVKDNVLQKISVHVGARDERRGEFEITEGIQAGDAVLRHPQGSLKEGAAVEMRTTAVANGV